MKAGSTVIEAIAIDDKSADPDDQVTQFEAITAIAFVAFRSAGVEAAVVEAGLGGRLDATNVLGDSRVQVLTGVGIDHAQYLGETIEEIAAEKLAVVRSRAALVSGPLGQVAAQVANRMADERDARWTELRQVDPVFAGVAGEFVRANASLALATAEVAHARIRPGASFLRDAAIEAILELALTKGIAGRLQLTNAEPFEIRDAAHNAQAAAALVRALEEVAGERPVTLLVAMLEDKPVSDTLAVLAGGVSDGGTVICTQSANPRSITAVDLASRIDELGESRALRTEAIADPWAALARAREVSGREGVLCVTGSNYLLADLLREPGAPAGATL